MVEGSSGLSPCPLPKDPAQIPAASADLFLGTGEEPSGLGEEPGPGGGGGGGGTSEEGKGRERPGSRAQQGGCRPLAPPGEPTSTPGPGKGKRKRPKGSRGARFEGVPVPHLVKQRKYQKEDCEEGLREPKKSDDYVLEKLFKKSGNFLLLCYFI